MLSRTKSGVLVMQADLETWEGGGVPKVNMLKAQAWHLVREGELETEGILKGVAVVKSARGVISEPVGVEMGREGHRKGREEKGFGGRRGGKGVDGDMKEQRGSSFTYTIVLAYSLKVRRRDQAHPLDPHFPLSPPSLPPSSPVLPHHPLSPSPMSPAAASRPTSR